MQKGYDLCVSCKDHWDIAAYAKINLALVAKKAKDYAGALRDIDSAASIVESHQLTVWNNAIILSEKGGLFLKTGRPEEAYPLLKKAIALRDSLKIPLFTYVGTFEGEYYLAEYYLAKGDFKDAEICLLNACREASEAKLNSAILKYERALANLYAGHQDPGKATSVALGYIGLSDSIREVQNRSNVSEYEIRQKELSDLNQLQRQKLIRNGFMAGFGVVLLFAGLFFSQRNKIRKGKKRSDDLLLNILPEEVAEELKETGHAAAKHYNEVTVLFTDFKGFTQLSEHLTPIELVAEINECFSAFDQITTKFGLEKIKTIGDAYMAVGGLPVPNKTHAADAIRAALEIARYMARHKQEREAQSRPFFEVRIGIHSGPVVAGIVGVKKFQYDIWGDTVNTSSRMESSGEVGKVNISEVTYNRVADKFNCTYRGQVQAKNKGLMTMYFVEGEKSS